MFFAGCGGNEWPNIAEVARKFDCVGRVRLR